MPELRELASPAAGNAHFLSLRSLTFSSPGVSELTTGEDEHVLDVLAGRCSLAIWTSAGRAQEFAEVGGRPDIFSGKPEFVYIPRGCRYAVRCLEAPFEAAIYSAPTDETAAPLHVPAGRVKVLTSGISDWRRDVYIGLGDDGPARRMMVGETASPPGNWSGFPPHRHSQHRPPEELALEELFYLKFTPPSGFAIGGRYQDPNDRAGTAQLSFVGNNQVFDAPDGYHFIAPCPGYRLHYTWALGGRETKFGAWVADADYAWLSNYREE